MRQATFTTETSQLQQDKDRASSDQFMQEYEKMRERLQNVDDSSNSFIPSKISDSKNLEIWMHNNRTVINFDREIQSLQQHEDLFSKGRLQYLTNNIYIPKMKVKAFANFMYNGESDQNYNNYGLFSNENLVFKDAGRSRDEVILGIESSFDESAASLVNSFGELKADHQLTQWEQWRDNDGIDPKVAAEKHQVNIPIVVERALDQYKITKGDKRFKGISVTVGPGQESSLNIGIKYAQKLAKEYDVPVYPVNHIEAHVFTPRFSRLNGEQVDGLPRQQFPFLTLLATGKHTELVLTRGVGLHTILGMTIDCGIGECLDKAYLNFKKYHEVLRDSTQITDFVHKYNANPVNENKIPEGYFTFLQDEKIARGQLIELLGKYGDPSVLTLPLGFKQHANCDMTFTGIKTAIGGAFLVTPDNPAIPYFEREVKKLSFEDLVNYASSIQFGLFSQIVNKAELALEWCRQQEIPLTGFNISGGVSCNEELRQQCLNICDKFNLPMVIAPKKLCTDNAQMIAWMGWELLNSGQEVDIRDMRFNALKRIPLGSYVEGLVSIRTPNARKIITNKQLAQINDTMAKKQHKMRKYNYSKVNQNQYQQNFKEVNNLFAYSIKDPSQLTTKQKINRLYKGVLRKLLAQHVFTIRRTNFDRFHDEQYRVRQDFDKILKSKDQQEINIMLEKYELYVEKFFEPYAAMHESRPHSNLWGKHLIYGHEALATDHIGYYKPVLVNGEPSSVHFHEQYPHMVTAWVYDHKYLNNDFNYEDLEKQYLDSEKKQTQSPDDLKQKLDEAHNQH